MTRPIYEPSLQRTDRRLGYTSDQLLRRPAPAAGGCPCPVDSAIAFDAVLGSGTANVSNATLTTINFDQVFASAGSTAFTVNPGTTPITLLLDGWYFFYLNFDWDGGGFTDVRLYELTMNTTADNDGASMTTTDGIGGEESSPYQSAFRKTWGPLYFRGTVQTHVKVRQDSGISKGVTGVLYTAVYYGPDMDPGAFPPF